VLVCRYAYHACDNDKEKTRIAQIIVDFVKNSNGRFLLRDSKDEAKRWFVLPDKVPLDKVKQALRDKYVPFWAKGVDVPKAAQTCAKRFDVPKVAPMCAKVKESAPPSQYVDMNTQYDDFMPEIEVLPSFQNQGQPRKFPVGH
jgi:hypothetical protein